MRLCNRQPVFHERYAFAFVRLRAIQFTLFAGLLAGCASQSPVKSVEMLDEKSGMTMGALLQPMAFIETGISDLLVPPSEAR
ncbi:MAG: hypothetical protein JWN43_3208 [Gammaproteobacteria bacterium]|nr:hypothetical protein [Gammaproteobacteria bacterium]